MSTELWPSSLCVCFRRFFSWFAQDHAVHTAQFSSLGSRAPRISALMGLKHTIRIVLEQTFGLQHSGPTPLLRPAEQHLNFRSFSSRNAAFPFLALSPRAAPLCLYLDDYTVLLAGSWEPAALWYWRVNVTPGPEGDGCLTTLPCPAARRSIRWHWRRGRSVWSHLLAQNSTSWLQR